MKMKMFFVLLFCNRLIQKVRSKHRVYQQKVILHLNSSHSFVTGLRTHLSWDHRCSKHTSCSELSPPTSCTPAYKSTCSISSTEPPVFLWIPLCLYLKKILVSRLFFKKLLFFLSISFIRIDDLDCFQRFYFALFLSLIVEI